MVFFERVVSILALCTAVSSVSMAIILFTFVSEIKKEDKKTLASVIANQGQIRYNAGATEALTARTSVVENLLANLPTIETVSTSSSIECSSN